jgi:hypothetical protein
LDLFQNSGTKIGAGHLYNFVTKSVMPMTEKKDIFIEDLEDYISASRKIMLLCSNEHSAKAMIDMLIDENIPHTDKEGNYITCEFICDKCGCEFDMPVRKEVMAL